eukprot:6429478-Amphidinium_carterae.1
MVFFLCCAGSLERCHISTLGVGTVNFKYSARLSLPLQVLARSPKPIFDSPQPLVAPSLLELQRAAAATKREHLWFKRPHVQTEKYIKSWTDLVTSSSVTGTPVDPRFAESVIRKHKQSCVLELKSF